MVEVFDGIRVNGKSVRALRNPDTAPATVNIPAM